MSRNLAYALVKFVNTIVATIVVFLLIENWWRHVEASAIAGLLGVLGFDRANTVFGSAILVRPDDSQAFFATLNASCSTLGATLAFTMLAVFMLHGSIHRRAAAAGAAAVFALSCNMVRIGIALVIGSEWGSHSMVVFHDWIGTIIGLFAILGSFMVFVYVLLPSNKRLLELARVD